MQKLLLTGASGFLGWNICQAARTDWMVFGTYRSNRLEMPGITLTQADLTDYEELKRLLRLVRPDAVIHTAAVSSADFCQQNRSETYGINTEVPINIAGLCSDLEIPCLFTSSDLIFDGLNPPYVEEDEPCPVSVYGEQKVLAELGMRERYPETVICRMPLMFGDPGPVAVSFLQPLIATMESGSKANLFVDEFRTPVSGRDAAAGLMIAIKELPHIIHLGGPERISRYEFGQLVADMLNFPHDRLNPCRQEDLNLSAPRPRDVSFDSSKAHALGFYPKSIRDELEFLRQAIIF